MAERQQQVAPRAKRPAARRPARPAVARRRGVSAKATVRAAVVAALALLPVVAYFAVADSAAFTLRRVEVDGARRTEAARLEQVVRQAAGSQLLGADLDDLRRALERERYVRAASVVRVLPDTLRVRIEEREPVAVARLGSGRLVWVDADGYVLEDFRPEGGGAIPPPLTGYEDAGGSDRVATENRDRIARYLDVREALGAGDLWERLDEVDIRYLRNVHVRLADSGVLVRLGERDYGERLATALSLLDAVRLGDTETLARYRVADIGRLLAAPEAIVSVDVARDDGRVSFNFLTSNARQAGRN
jgi:hypothetical protein